MSQGWTLNDRPIQIPWPPQAALSLWEGVVGDVQSEHIYFKSRVLEGNQPGKFLFLSDVEGETNGLYTYDRVVRKVAADAMLEIAERVTENLRDCL